MSSTSKVVMFGAFQKPLASSSVSVPNEKLASPGDSEKTAEAAENIGLAGISGDTASA
ncbi:MAG: hypothetical protein ABSF67_14990 [Roseiarcus sp.]|jgi:hypothetical protein